MFVSFSSKTWYDKELLKVHKDRYKVEFLCKHNIIICRLYILNFIFGSQCGTKN